MSESNLQAESVKNVTLLARLIRQHGNSIFFTILLGLALLFWPTRTLRSDNFVFYFPATHQVVPLELIGQTKYLPLLKVLNLVVKVAGLQEKSKSVTVWFGNTHLELHLDDKRARVNQQWVALSNPIRVRNGQWMVPVEFLTAVLPKFTRDQVSYQEGANRVLIGDVKTTSFTARLDPLANGARLTLQFTDQVTVSTVAKDGAWVMYLGEHPVEPLEQTYEFQNPYVRQLRFDDHDGVPKLILTPAGNGFNFYPGLAEGGKVLLADVLQPPPPTEGEQPKPQEAPSTRGPAAPPASGIEEAPAAEPGPPLPLVVLDAGHGGDDVGARSRDGVLEKDLVAQLVTRARAAVLETKKFRILLTRVGDTNPTFEQRAVAANVARPAVFLTFHAGNLGAGLPQVAVYTYQAPSSLAPSRPEGHMPLIPWTMVQRTHLAHSRQLAQLLQERLTQRLGAVAGPPAQAPVRALRSVDAPAVAIEVGSLSPDADSAPLTNLEFQRQIAAAIAQALEDLLGRTS